ncbi:hypothetical protein J5X84_08990 [Streptosporangiaceae bacterium NEAU-GS5]|nr:hypothetical protein [Streptosporangiaceae bacterium NEAU-GS5]
MSTGYSIEIKDLDVEGAELSDDELLAVRGGIFGQNASTCNRCTDNDMD